MTEVYRSYWLNGPPGQGYIESVDLKGIFTGTDRWLFIPALVSLITVAALAFVAQLPGWDSLSLILFSLVGYAIAFLVGLAITIYCFIKRRPRRAASVLLMFLLPIFLWRPIIWVTEVAHVGFTVGFGVGQLSAPSKSSDGNFAAYDWSIGFAGSNTFLIHDVTDEIALPMAQHKHSADSEIGFAEDCAGKVDHLIGHYYVCNF